MKVKTSDKTSANSMRSVVRAAYSGRLAGSSDTGVIRNSDSGCSRWRLASAKKTSRPNVSSIASRSQRVPTRPDVSTEIGMVPRMRLAVRASGTF